MAQHTTEASFVGARTRNPARSAARRIGALALLLTLVMGTLSSCIIVPVGHGHDGGRRRDYRHDHRWDH
jgi:hypothetical protein